MSYGPNFLDLYWRTADLVNKILREATPADIPAEQPTKKGAWSNSAVESTHPRLGSHRVNPKHYPARR
jgi:hypothetical protein